MYDKDERGVPPQGPLFESRWEHHQINGTVQSLPDYVSFPHSLISYSSLRRISLKLPSLYSLHGVLGYDIMSYYRIHRVRRDIKSNWLYHGSDFSSK